MELSLTGEMPGNPEAEAAVLGCMLLNEQAVPEIVGKLNPTDFYVKGHQLVYKAILTLVDEHVGIDHLTVRQRLLERGELEQAGGSTKLIELTETVPSLANAQHYGQIVSDCAVRRELIRTAADLANLSDGENLLEHIAKTAARLRESALRCETEGNVLRLLLEEVLDSLEAKASPALLSGFGELDSITGGFFPGELTILAARPSVGKSTLMLNFVANVARRGARVLIFSAEMMGRQLAMNMLSAASGVSTSFLRSGQLVDADWRLVSGALGPLCELDVTVDDRHPVTLKRIAAAALRAHRVKPLSLICVDYLQLVKGPKSERRDLEIGAITAQLSALAKTLKVPVLALCQLNRGVEARQDKRPVISDLRESGNVEQDADVIMLLYRQSYYQRGSTSTSAEIAVGKNRNGPTGVARLEFLESTLLFREARGEADGEDRRSRSAV